MDEIRRSLEAIFEALATGADALHKLADLAANPQLDPEIRARMAESVHTLADEIEEKD